MSLPSLSIHRPVMSWMLTAGVVLLGLLSMRKLGVSRYPDIDNPTVSVSISYPGTSPELMETDVTDVLEGALSSVEGVVNMTSNSRFGSSSVTLEFEIDRNIDAAIQDVNAVMQGISRRLPEGVDPPVVRKSNPEDRPILQLALSGGEDRRSLMFLARTSVRDRLTTIEGVSEVSLGGFLDPVIRVWLDPQKLAAFELTHRDVITALQSEHKEIPIGRIVRSKDEISLRFLGETHSIEELSKLFIIRRSGSLLYRKVTLGELGRIESGLEDVRSLARSDGHLSVGLGILKQRGANAVQVADRVRDFIKTLELPQGYRLDVNYDLTGSIRSSVHELAVTLGISVLLTSLVCWLFLGSFASTFNIILAIPTSLLGTFWAMQKLGYTLNIFTMLALILSIGIVVDDAIMVLENIFRWRESEKSSRRAALKGSEQVQFAAIATTIAIVAIFIPVVFVDGITGAYLSRFGVVLCVAVLFSTFEALTLTPMRLASLKTSPVMRGLPARFDAQVKKMADRYAEWTRQTLRRPRRAFFLYALGLGVFVLSLVLVKKVPRELIPEEDTGALLVRAQLPLGTSLETTSLRMSDLEKEVQGVPGIQRVYTIVGGWGGDVNSGVLFVSLSEPREQRPSQDAIQKVLRQKFKKLAREGLVVRIQSAGGTRLGGRRGYPVELTLKGKNWNELVSGAAALEKALAAGDRLADVNMSYEEGSPEGLIVPDREKARGYGVAVADIADTLSFMYNGVQAVKFDDDGRRVDVVVKADPEKTPTTLKGLKSVYVRNARGQLVSLTDIVKVSKGLAPVSITRENRERSISVFGNVAPGHYQGESLEWAREVAQQTLPEGVRVDNSGQSGSLAATFESLLWALALGVVVAYMVLASQFNSYLHPLTVLLALPFSVTGAFLALYVGGATLNLFSMIGLLLLMGIVKKNSIMLVEFANQEREHGLSSAEAMVESCRTRFRPILMTAFTTLAAALPPALKIGISAESSASMSLGIVGGVLFSTLMTYFIVPLAYVHLSRWEHLEPTEE